MIVVVAAYADCMQLSGVEQLDVASTPQHSLLEILLSLMDSILPTFSYV